MLNAMIIKNLLFDMDNTLYPETSLIDKNMTQRIIAYVSDFFSLPLEEAACKRQDGLSRCGTTLEWLYSEHNLTDTEGYFTHLHPPHEVEEVDFDPNLRPFLENLKEKYHLTVLTNAPKIHADYILNHLKVYDLFDGVYDLEYNKFFGKPHKDAYVKAIEEKGHTIEETLFFDDLPKYIKGFSDIGGRAVLIDQTGRYKNDIIAKEHAYATLSSIYEIPQLLKNLD